MLHRPRTCLHNQCLNFLHPYRIPHEPLRCNGLSDNRPPPHGQWFDEYVVQRGGVVTALRVPDAEAFSRLEAAMRGACAALDEDSAVDRWLVEGFWQWTAVIPELAQHPEFTSPEPHYFRRCLARLRDLGSWFFNGTSPYGPDHVWEPIS